MLLWPARPLQASVLQQAVVVIPISPTDVSKAFNKLEVAEINLDALDGYKDWRIVSHTFRENPTGGGTGALVSVVLER